MDWGCFSVELRPGTKSKTKFDESTVEIRNLTAEDVEVAVKEGS